MLIALVQFLLLINMSKIASFFDIYDLPDNKRKKHPFSIPLFGGFILFLPTVLFVLSFPDPNLISNKLRYNYTYALLIILVSLIGFYDDKLNINNKKRILLLLISLIGITFLSPNIFIVEKIKFSFYENDINTYYLKTLIFPLGFVTLSIILNLIDGKNGILLLFFLIFLILHNKYFYSEAYIYLIITSFILLFLNLKNKLFMGSLGVNIITMIISFNVLNINNLELLNIDKIFLIFILPFTDAFYLFIYRLNSNQSPFKADDNHFHNILIKKFNYVTEKNCFIFYNIIAFSPYFFFKVSNEIFSSLILFMIIYIYLRAYKL